MSPAKVVSVDVSEEEKSSYVVVPDYQLSLAIGKAGQNARLAAKLTNWKIDIKSETQAAEEPFAGFGNAEGWRIVMKPKSQPMRTCRDVVSQR